MGGNTHHGAGTVIHDDIVGDPKLDAVAVQGVDDVFADEHPLFFQIAGGSVHRGERLHLFLKFLDAGFVFGAGHQFFHDGMFRGENHEGHTVNGIGAGGEYGDGFIGIFQFEINFHTGAAADPVFLHGLNFVGPTGEEFQIVQQPLGIIGDLEEPLGEIFLFHFGMAAFAAAIHNLFVGENRGTGRAPVHRGFLFVGQTVFVELEKDPLGIFIVIGETSRHFTVPVVADTESLELAAHIVHVAQRPFHGMHLMFDGGVFRGQTEGIPAHGVQNIISLHFFETGHHITDGVVAHMTHMQVPRGIREHFQKIILFFFAVFRHFEGFFFFPFFLPFGFNGLGFVLFIHNSFSYIVPEKEILIIIQHHIISYFQIPCQ